MGFLSDLRWSLAETLHRRALFPRTDEAVLLIARNYNVFVEPGDAIDDRPDWRVNLRIYRFARLTMTVRIAVDAHTEIAAMADLAHGGGCLYPPPERWAMQDNRCGQGYRVPNAYIASILERVAEVAEWCAARSMRDAYRPTTSPHK